MTSEISDRQTWLKFISELNNRSLISQRASGLTTWAVGGLIALLLFRVIENIPIIISDQKLLWLNILTIAIILNLVFFSLGLFICLLAVSGLRSERRIKSRIDRASKPVVYVPLFLASFIIISANIFSAKVSSTWYIPSWPFWSLGAFFILNMVATPLTKIHLYIKNRKFYKDLPQLSSSIIFHQSSQVRYLVLVLLSIVFSIGLILSSLPFIYAYPTMFSADRIQLIKFAMYVASLLYLSLLMCFRVVGDIQQNFLFNLERKIVLESLNPDQIKSEFIKEYLGESVRDWIINAEKNLSKFHETFEHAAKDAEKKFQELASLDRNLSYEIKGRKKDICENFKKSTNDYLNFGDKLLAQISHLNKEMAFYDVPDIFSQLLQTWKKHIDDMGLKTKKVCSVCEELTSDQSDKIDSHAQADWCSDPRHTSK